MYGLGNVIGEKAINSDTSILRIGGRELWDVMSSTERKRYIRHSLLIANIKPALKLFIINFYEKEYALRAVFSSEMYRFIAFGRCLGQNRPN